MLDQSWGKVTESSAQMKATIARLQKAYQEAPLWAFDAGAGKKSFQQICAVCHTMNGEGGKLGPDLTGSGRNGLAYFLENIVDPNAVVGEQYQMTIITKRDGTVITGIAEQESQTAVTIRTVTELLVVPKSEIKDRQKKAESMMPAGILEATSRAECDRASEISDQQELNLGYLRGLFVALINLRLVDSSTSSCS